MAMRSTMRSTLGRVRGMGAAKDGTHHFWAQRLTAIALVPLTLWFVYSVVGLVGRDYDTVQLWAGRQINAAGLIALVVATFHHAQLGLQTIIEDYMHDEGAKFITLIVMKLVCAAFGLAGIVAVIKLAFGG
jgi:succinate dehydrogenase / fumarate reductase membrane anchor subunit